MCCVCHTFVWATHFTEFVDEKNFRIFENFKSIFMCVWMNFDAYHLQKDVPSNDDGSNKNDASLYMEKKKTIQSNK